MQDEGNWRWFTGVTTTEVKLDIDPNEYRRLLEFFSRKEGLSFEDVRRILGVRCHKKRRRAYVHTHSGGMDLAFDRHDGAGFLVNLFVALSTAPGAWARAAAYLISIPAAACFFFRIGINPRLRLQDRCWESGLTLEEKLDRIYEIQKIPWKQIVKEHFEKQRLAVIGVALICMIVLVFSVYRDAVKADDYQKRMSTIAVSAGNTGARYAVYDENAGKFVKDCLKKEQLAQTPEDVRAVLYIRSGSQLLTTYGEAGYMYMRYALIRMVDQKTGETLGERYVYGYMSSRLYEQTQNGTRAAYGEYPEKEDIEEAIEELIEAFEYTIK